MSNPRKVSNIETLTDSLAEQYERLTRKEISTEEADAMSKIAASMIMACRVQIEYNKQHEVAVPIKFLEPTPSAEPSLAEQMRMIENKRNQQAALPAAPAEEQKVA